MARLEWKVGDVVITKMPVVKGGPGSGNFGHAGRPGERGGSGGGGSSDILKTNNIEEAARAILAGRRVELEQPREVSTLLDKLAAIAQDAKSKGQKAPLYDIGKVSVKGTNLFALNSKDIPRIEMPQLSVDTPNGGTRDLTSKFIDSLRERGIKVQDTTEQAAYLRATQNELNGAKVAGIMQAIENGNKALDERSIVVSRDNYILDGHHTWAAHVGLDSADNIMGNNSIMHIQRVDMGIGSLLFEAQQFADKNGLANASVAKGGSGSGNFGHAGRPGERGGSGEGGSTGIASRTKDIIDAVTNSKQLHDDPLDGKNRVGGFLLPNGNIRTLNEGEVHLKVARQILDDAGIKSEGQQRQLTNVTDAGIPRVINWGNAGIQMSAPLTSDQKQAFRDLAASTPENAAVAAEVYAPNDKTGFPIWQTQVANTPMEVARLLREADQAAGAPVQKALVWIQKGGAGSGNFGHSGRPGQVGGSSFGEGGASRESIEGRALSDRGVKSVADYIKAHPSMSAKAIQDRMDKLLASAQKSGIATSAKDWYVKAGNLSASKLGALGYNREQSIAMVAATSPRCRWEENNGTMPNLAAAVVAGQAVKENPGIQITQEMIDTYQSSKSTVNQAVGKLFPEPGVYAFNDLNPRVSGTLLGVRATPDGLGKAIAIAQGASIDETLQGSKVRSFYTNLVNPSRDGVATIDGWMGYAMLGDTGLANGDPAKEMNARAAFISKPEGYRYLVDQIDAGSMKAGLTANQYQAILWTQSKQETGYASA